MEKAREVLKDVFGFQSFRLSQEKVRIESVGVVHLHDSSTTSIYHGDADTASLRLSLG